MNEPLLQAFRAALVARFGLQFDDDRNGQLEDLLLQRAAAAGSTPQAWLRRLQAGLPLAERRALVEQLTVGETYFFRNREQFAAMREVCMPARRRARADGRALRILSAGCSSGEEPYSIAIVAREAGLEPGRDVEIRALDINPQALAKAAAARYSPWSLRETSNELRQRWFRDSGGQAVLEPSIRAAVTFEECNLVEDHPALSPNQGHDIVFCRNMLMYLAQPVAQALVARLAASLAPGGYLFLGHAETLRGLSHDFHLLHSHDTFYYQRKAELNAAPPAPAEVALAPSVLAAVDSAEHWIDAIGRASERVEALSRSAQRAVAPPARAHAPQPAPLQAVHALLQHERYDAALDQLQRMTAHATTVDADVLLLQAVLQAHRGELDAAQAACMRLLEHDELNAGAHYVLALCREGSSDRRGAEEHDRTAIHLDPTFAMPHLHLGLLSRRAGDVRSAARAFADASSLLQREDAARLLLFGGGFGREALLALCRAELAACGGRP